MLSPELIVGVVRDQRAGFRPGPIAPSSYDYEAEILDIPQSIKCSLARLNDCSVPYIGGEIVERRREPEVLTRVKIVETAVWPILPYAHTYAKDGTVTFRQLLIDAYGDLLGRIITQSPNRPSNPDRVLVFPPSRLSSEQRDRVLYELRVQRNQLLKGRIAVQPSLV